MAFQFSLASVLRVRRIMEEREEGKLQKIHFDISQTSRAIEDTDAQLAQSYTSRLSNVLKPYIGLDFQASYGEVQELKLRRKDLEARMQKLEEARKAQVAVYEAARRNREMLTDLREKKRRAYESEMSKREQKALDDNFAARRSRS